jgi:hypothetical protein
LGLVLALDYSVSSLLKISVSSLQAFLLAGLAAIAIGAGVFLMQLKMFVLSGAAVAALVGSFDQHSTSASAGTNLCRG